MGLWRFGDWLPVSESVTLGETTTPVLAAEWRKPPKTLLKIESALPTGSFKDRGSAVLVSHLKEQGVGGIVVDSSGNAGASLAAYCAAARLTARVFVPATASPAKLVQIRAYDAEVVPIEGTRSDVAEAALAAAHDDLTYASHIWSPFFIVGTQTFAFELVEQLAGAVPDAVVFPLGAGTLLFGAYLGFRALRDAGLTDRMPRLFGVQAAACPSFANAWAGSSDGLDQADCRQSIAEGILIARPPRARAVVAAVRDTGGAIVTVEEHEIASTVLELARHGIYAEPTAAVAQAGLDAVLGLAKLPNEATIVVAITASGLKSSSAVAALIDEAER